MRALGICQVGGHVEKEGVISEPDSVDTTETQAFNTHWWMWRAVSIAQDDLGSGQRPFCEDEAGVSPAFPHSGMAVASVSDGYENVSITHSVIYHDLPWFTMIYHDLPWFTMIYPFFWVFPLADG